MRRIIATLIGLIVTGYAGVSFAFPAHRYWHYEAAGASGMSGTRPGAAGIYYTGGKQDYGLKCSSCHIDNAQQQGTIGVTIAAVPVWQSVGGIDTYVPGQVYDVTVTLTGEHLHSFDPTTGAASDQNGMALTIENAQGTVAGVFQADVGPASSSAACQAGTAPDPLTVDPTANQTTVLFGNCHGVLAVARPAAGAPRTSWHFRWTAPAAGAGDLTLFVGVVDGDEPDVTSLDDDVREVSIPLAEGS